MNDRLLKAYNTLTLLRVAEEEIAQLYLKDKIMSFIHFYVGQEAIAVGVSDNLKPEDKVLGNHRSHGHYLAKGGDLRRMLCELLGKENGSSKGKGGSMHMIDKSVNFIGSTPILGSVVPIASGTAFEQKYNKKSGITVGYLGDGAFEEGVVYETMNLAALFKLPLLLVVENNLYAVNSKLKDRRSADYNVEKVVTGIGLKYLKADGNDYEDVYAKAKTLIEGVRNSGAPAVLECVAYRHMAHSAPIFDDAQGYREEDVLEKRLEKDPIKKVMKTLVEQGAATEAELVAMKEKIRAEVLESIEYAKNSSFPKKETLYTNLYA